VSLLLSVLHIVILYVTVNMLLKNCANKVSQSVSQILLTRNSSVSK